MDLENKFEAITKLEDQAEFDEALRLVNELEMEVQGDDSLLVRILARKAGILWITGNLDKGLEVANKGLAIANTLKSSEIKREKLRLLRTKASIYSGKGEHKNALETNQTNLALAEEIGDKNEIASSLNNLGTVYDSRGMLKEALNCYQQGLAIAKEINGRLHIAVFLNNLGTVYHTKGMLKEALNYYEECLEYRNEFRNQPYFAAALANKIEIYLIQRDRESAFASLQIFDEFLVSNTNKYIQLFYDKSKALYLKSSKRNRDKVQAELLFQKIVDDEVILVDITLTAMNQLAELLLFEYKTYEEQEVLDDIIKLIDKMYWSIP